MNLKLQNASMEIWKQKYQLKNSKNEPIDKSPEDNFRRVAKALSKNEKTPEVYEEAFFEIMNEGGCYPAGRILANSGAEKYKPATSLINCTVSQTIEDSIDGITESVRKAGLTLASGAGIGYEFSTLRPTGSYINGPGAETSGPLSFMEIFDSMCKTIASAGGRRGAQMATFAVWHPDVKKFIGAKRTNGAYRQFNFSLLIDDEFMDAVINDLEYKLVFPIKRRELDDKTEYTRKKIFWDKDYCEKQNYVLEGDEIVCKVYETIRALELWETIMKSTYDYAEPGFLLIDKINNTNNLYFTENIRATNPCITGDMKINTSIGDLRMVDVVDAFNNGAHILVRSHDIKNNTDIYTPIEKAFKTKDNAKIIKIVLDDGTCIKCTPDHLVYTYNRGYVEAHYLNEYDDISSNPL